MLPVRPSSTKIQLKYHVMMGTSWLWDPAQRLVMLKENGVQGLRNALKVLSLLLVIIGKQV